MNKVFESIFRRTLLKRALLLTSVCASLLSCAGSSPMIAQAAIGFGQDVLEAAAQNFAPGYSRQVDSLFVALVEQQSGIKLQPRAQSGYQNTQYGQDPYAQQQGYADPGYQQDPYGQQGYTEPGYQQDPYAQQGYTDPGYQQDPYAQQGYTEPGYQQDPYAQQGYADPGYQQDPYAQQGYADPGYQEQYGSTGSYPEQYDSQLASIPQPANNQQYQQQPFSGSVPPLSMDVALLAERKLPDGSVTMEPVQDGDTLYDGRGNPAAGDKLKIAFTVNCNCYVYVIGIDATAFVAQIFPDPDAMLGNPVRPGHQYMLPEGNLWWGLDEYRGIEQVYFVASQTRRTDIEQIINELSKTKRNVPSDFRPVRVAAVVPRTRGLVKVQSGPAAVVETQAGTRVNFTPTSFTSTAQGADLVITRWFNHQ